MYILFYSERVASCTNFIKHAQDCGIFRFFTELYCVDKMDKNAILNSGIKEVPCVLIKTPNGSQIYEGESAFKWLQEIIFSRQKSMIDRATEQRRQILIEANAKRDNGPREHAPMETAGVSDNFSYVSVGLVDQALPKSFMVLGNEDNNKILTFNTKGKEQKIDRIQQDKISEQYEKNRKMQDSMLKQEMNQNIINTVYNTKSKEM